MTTGKAPGELTPDQRRVRAPKGANLALDRAVGEGTWEEFLSERLLDGTQNVQIRSSSRVGMRQSSVDQIGGSVRAASQTIINAV